MSFDRYRAALRAPYVARLLLTSLAARAPQGMAGLAILLLVTRHGGYARAGVVTGVFVLTGAVTGPLLGRAVDRVGARVVLAPTAVGFAVAMAALAVVPQRLFAAVLGLAAVAGALNPPVGPVVRGLWPSILDAEQAQVVYGLETTMQELIFIVGPALVAVVAGVGSAPVAVVVTGALGLVGTVAFVATPALATRAVRQAAPHRRLLRTTRLPVYVLVALACTVAFNMCEIATVAFVSGRRASAASGIVLAIWSVGSMVGGLLFGASRGTRSDDVGIATALAVVGVGIVAAALSPGRWGLAVILAVGGAAIAPALGRLYSRVGTSMPDGTATEAFAWVGVGLIVGSAVGAASGGAIVEAVGARWAFVVAGGVPAAVAAVLLVALRGDSRDGDGDREPKRLSAAGTPAAVASGR